jgi:alpha-tubulin suppressor-like RCC1 family protein
MAFAAVTINPALLISPAVSTIGKGEAIQLSASGGSQPYTFLNISGAGSGTVNSSTGVYTAPQSLSTAIIRVTDFAGNSVDALINVVNKPQITTTQEKLATNFDLTITASEGTPPYSFSILSGGGSINSVSGLFTAPNTNGTVNIRVTDHNGLYDDFSINIFIPPLIASGFYHNCILNFSSLTDSITRCWGASMPDTGTFGFLGNSEPRVIIGDEVSDMGDNVPYLNFGADVLVQDLVFAGSFGCALTTNNQIKCWGYGGSGLMLQGSTVTQGEFSESMGDNLQPLDLGTGRTINFSLPFEDAFSTNNGTACAILDNNTIKCWGSGDNGRRGTGNTSNYGGASLDTPDGLQVINIGTDIPKKIVVGTRHTCLVNTLNQLKCWGANEYGQLGYGDTLMRGHTAGTIPISLPYIDLGTAKTIKSITLGDYHTCALLNDDKLKCWGYNGNGELGLGLNTTAAIGNDPGEMGDNLQYANLGTDFTKVLKVYASTYSSCALLDNNQVKCWGYNPYGNLGNGTTNGAGVYNYEMGDNLIPVNFGTGRSASDLFFGYYANCSKLDNQQVKCWGYNAYGNLGLGHLFNVGRSPMSLGDNLPHLNLGSGLQIQKVFIGTFSSCALLSNQKVKCWGQFYRGDANQSLGDAVGEVTPSIPPIKLPTGITFKEIKSFSNFNCGKTNEDKLLCWGINSVGQLGLEHTKSPFGFSEISTGDNFAYTDLGTGLTVKYFSTGDLHSCAILSDNTLKCWGPADYGKIGSSGNKGSAGNTMGDNLPTVSLGTVSYPVEVSAGYHHTCVLFANGKVKCFGYNPYGELGLGDNVQRGLTPATQMGDLLPFIDLGTGITAKNICAGTYYSCALLTNNTLKCWGFNARNASGLNLHLGDGPGEMGNNLLPIPLGNNFTPKKISCGQTHACVLSTKGELKCFGQNDNGQLGTGTTNVIGDYPTELGNGMPKINVGTGRYVVDVVTGSYHTCAVLDNNKVKCWGYNAFGTLGIGHRTSVGTNLMSTPNLLPYVEVVP